ncbi:MAG TPA: phenylphosphate carboxylase subunit delta [Gemmatimonadetes bacterium]|mgnify:FL=1|nr:phenylphosphate carboxylase subunit delta [Gemmatimonadota bacterium]|tara:strand:- start:100 stop:669 length:570 start_codon:yes stop_codon:yes gene_type:complete
MTRTSNSITRETAERIRLVIFDVDGVLTDAGLYTGTTAKGEAVELKRFDIQDGVGLKLLKWAGLGVVLVSGRVSEATSLRAKDLGIDGCYQVPDAHKLKVVRKIIDEREIGWDEVAMIGDDIPDLAVMRLVGLKAAVANATEPISSIADWQSTRSGGHGAVREFTDELLRARGDLDEIVEKYVSERSDI